jgi:hypothetical protein
MHSASRKWSNASITAPSTTAATPITPRQLNDSVLPTPPGLVEVLKYELINLRARALEMEKECKYKKT